MTRTEITISIPSDLYKQAQQLAERNNRTVAEVLSDAIHLPDEAKRTALQATEQATEDEQVEQEKQAFITLHPMLLEKFPGQYVAIYQGELVDHDQDAVALTRRIFARYPHDFVWIAPVKPKPIEELNFRSPRFR